MTDKTKQNQEFGALIDNHASQQQTIQKFVNNKQVKENDERTESFKLSLELKENYFKADQKRSFAISPNSAGLRTNATDQINKILIEVEEERRESIYFSPK